ncbi:PD-(D/E)XK nuclease family transposase [Thiorhodovibrio winogradskyi]|uniref:PD-(D/E)XK nuclease family transposase n=1 Tax=Thiorhodovibrio winogradskyi TaxID=77007 RepID=A0ABZ0S5E8_9GAMM|nr:Rpn family recombination-promoting nuclease/putative transposase [Thiorhodovibrio winogradskyi]
MLPAPTMTEKTNRLLDPKNDYVFFRIFSEEPELLIDLINAVRADEPPIVEITLLDARLTPERITGKRLVLDLKGVDERGRRFNIEIQVQHFTFWIRRAMMYLSRLYSEQLEVGKDYQQAQAVIGIHLLDFDLFKGEPGDKNNALWRFVMYDPQRAKRLEETIEVNIVELRKADRLGQLPERLSAWIAYFEHWNEEAVMNNLAHPAVQKAHAKLRVLSADEQERYWAEARARALSDEVTLLNAARREGHKEGAIESTRRTLLRQLHSRFGEAAAEQSKPMLERITDLDRLEQLADDVVLCTDADSWLAALHTAAEQ